MQALELDWRALRWPGVAAAVAAIVLAVTLQWALGQWRERQHALATAERARAQAAKRLDAAHDDRIVYRRYAARFRAMRKRGWVGATDAAGWSAVMARLERQTPARRIRYDAGERTRVRPSEGPLANDTIALTARPMTVGLAAPHEGGLITALRRLGRLGPGLMGLRACRLERTRPPGALALDGERANIRARCRVRWYAAHLGPPAERES